MTGTGSYFGLIWGGNENLSPYDQDDRRLIDDDFQVNSVNRNSELCEQYQYGILH